MMLSLLFIVACMSEPKTEAERLQASCSAKEPDPSACYQIADSLLEEGQQEEAIAQYKKTCSIEVKLDLDKRPGCLKVNQIGCDSKDHDACVGLGNMLAHGDGVEQNVNAAATLFKLSCDTGDKTACASLQWVQTNRKHLKAVESDRKGCAAKEMDACSSLGMRHIRKEIKNPNLKKAFDLFSMACKANVYAACNQLAWLYMSSNKEAEESGISVHDGEALKYYVKACDGEYGLACANLGQVYKRGDGVSVHLKSAVKRFQQACDLKSPEGCLYMAELYEEGIGVPAHEARATEYRSKACGLGLKAACGNADPN